MNYMLIMETEQSALVAIGPMAIEYQAAMLRDELEESSGWTTVGIARILTETQARAAIAAGQDAAPASNGTGAAGEDASPAAGG
jgi:hypothetical protein